MVKLKKYSFISCGFVISFLVGVLTDEFVYAYDHHLNPSVTLNWMGVIITIFSLSVTIFLVLLAIEAVGHVAGLEQSKKSQEKMQLLINDDREKFDEYRMITANQSRKNAENLFNIVFYLKNIIKDENKNTTKINNLIEKYMVDQAVNFVRIFSERTSNSDSEKDDMIANIFLVAEKGNLHHLKEIIGFINQVDFLGKDNIVSSMKSRIENLTNT